jgi:hypothetical protein
VANLDEPQSYRVTTASTNAVINRVSGARHVLRLVNGQLGNLPTRGAGVGGFTVACENPLYIYGTYNALTTGYGGAADPPHAAAGIVADAVTLLSNSWYDMSSFVCPDTWTRNNYPTAGLNYTRVPAEANIYYRVAIAAGKNLTFPNAGGAVNANGDFGTDGGVHNFLRYMENWGGKTIHYQGSIVSLFHSEQGVGIYKGGMTYSPPTRDYMFDLDFKDPTKLPPGTPKFRDVVNLGYRQDVRAPN